MEHILYINLEHRKDRKRSIEAQLSAMGLVGERVDATYHVHGYIGCTMSHIQCLELAIERNYPMVCICEDDVLFTNPTEFSSLLHTFMSTHTKWDVLLLAGNAAPPYRKEEGCRQIYNARTTTAYIVHQSYYSTLLNNFREGLALLTIYYRNDYMIDMYWRRLQQKDSWYILDPLTVVQLPSYSDIENRSVDYRQAMLSFKDS
jgi:GR25 family glycosyltransferase involved in LPS biosynthesis